MKMVVAYVDRDKFEPIREELLDSGFLSLSVWEASGSVPEAMVAGTYRGVPVERHLRPKSRLECVVGAEHTRTVVDTVLKHGGERTFAFVFPIEEAYPSDTIKGETVAAPAA